jgi:hypothetical protein
MWKTVYDKLKEHSLNPYPPGIHTGECTTRYCVVIEGNQIPSVGSNRTGQRVLDVIAYIPASNYPAMEVYKKEIKAALKEIQALRCTGFETPIIAEDEKKAFSSSIEYTILKKLEG